MDPDFDSKHPRAGTGRFTEKDQMDPGNGVLPGPQVQVKAGMEFTHNRFQDLDWHPGPGQRYADAPLARMKVTARRNGFVYYTYANDPTNKAGWHEREADFIATFGDQLAGQAVADRGPVELRPGMTFTRTGKFGDCEITKVTGEYVLFKPVGYRGASMRNTRDVFERRYGDQFR